MTTGGTRNKSEGHDEALGRGAAGSGKATIDKAGLDTQGIGVTEYH